VLDAVDESFGAASIFAAFVSVSLGSSIREKEATSRTSLRAMIDNSADAHEVTPQ
jgi:hypothetical protein